MVSLGYNWGPEIEIVTSEYVPSWMANKPTAIYQNGTWCGLGVGINARSWIWGKDITKVKFLADDSYYAQLSAMTAAKDGYKEGADYGALQDILDAAYDQSAKGKGVERHGNGLPWTQQPIMAISRSVGIGFPTGQAVKKITEAVGMLRRGDAAAAERELLGAIVYVAGAIQWIREQ